MAKAGFVRGVGLGIGLDLAVVLLAGAAPGFAQQAAAPAAPTPAAAPAAPAATPGATNGVPAREGNIWDHTAHQPTAAVGGAEQQAGVAPPAGQARREDEELARINRQLQLQHGVKNPTPIQ